MPTMYLVLLAVVVLGLALVIASYFYVEKREGPQPTSTVTEPRWVRWVLTTVALLFMLIFLILPLLSVFGEALPMAAVMATGAGFRCQFSASDRRKARTAWA